MSLASWALLTLQDGKEHLGLGSTNEFDPVVEGMIESATLICEGPKRGCDRMLASRTFTEVYDGTACSSLRLRQYPVTGVTSVSFQSWPIAPIAQDTSAHGLYIVQPIQDTIAFRDLFFPWGRQNVTVVYTAGLGTAALGTIPQALKDAARIALKAIWDARDKQNTNIASQTFPGGQTVTYDRRALNEEFDLLVAPYKRCAWV